jgi:hypothetical protein
VNFLVNGQTAFTTTAPPYEFAWTVPQTVGPVTLGATAVDLGGNVGTAQSVTVNVVADPHTIVAGRVVDINGSPLAGASVVTSIGFSGTTQADGSFAIPGVSTVLGNFVVSANVVVNGPPLGGTSASFAPVPGGITKVGDIAVLGAASFVQIPGFANSVAVSGDFAYIAAGAAGFQIVDLSHSRTNPQIVSSLSIPGNADGVALAGNRAYLSMGFQGLAAVDITNASTPQLLGSLNIPGVAMAATVRGTTAFVTAQSNNADDPLVLVDVTNPSAMSILSTTQLNGTAWGLDVDMDRHLAVVATGSNGISTVDFTDLAAPVLLASIPLGTASSGGSSDSRAVAIRGNFAFIADRVNSMTAVDISDPTHPVVTSQTLPAVGGQLNDIALSGNFALGADVSFNTSVPITDISTNVLQRRALLSFASLAGSSGQKAARAPADSIVAGPRNDHGISIAADNDFVYLATANDSFDRGDSFGDSRLYIGQFQVLQDHAGIAPTLSIIAPSTGTSVVAGSPVAIQVKASDDVGIPTVNFLVNGQIVFTSTAPPYQFTFTAPPNPGLLTLGATAVDLGGNIGTAQDIQITVIPASGQLTVVPDRGTKAVSAALNQNQFTNMPPFGLHQIPSNKPVILETIGSKSWNDWEPVLRLVP